MNFKSKVFLFILSICALASVADVVPVKGEVLGVSNVSAISAENEFIVFADETKIETTTAFEQKEVEENEDLDFKIEYKDDDEVEYGLETITQEGVPGKKTYKYLLTYWGEEIINKELKDTITEEPVTEIVSKGTKIIWRELPSQYGDYKYWYKLNVWATKYDGNCDGCRGLTYSGTLVRKGVCAVDPKVIPLGTNFYVVGYGMCRSEDIGGGVKGNHVDLGYEDVTKGEWRTGYTDVYLLTNSPQGDGDFYSR